MNIGITLALGPLYLLKYFLNFEYISIDRVKFMKDGKEQPLDKKEFSFFVGDLVERIGYLVDTNIDTLLEQVY